MQTKKVLITGITGFLGSHTAIAFLNKGYEVVGTLRNLERKNSVEDIINKHSSNTQLLSFREIDLESSEKEWVGVMENVDYVIHIASPFPTTLPKTDNEIVTPAKQGTLNVLKAATQSKVKKVIITSSSGAVVYGKKKIGLFTEEDWTDVSNYDDTTPYFRSKTIAEQAAWHYVGTTPNAPELVTILPGAILGPILENDFGTSANLVKKLLDGSMPAMPKIGYELVDVRSVASAFILAVENEKANGNRFLCANGFLTFSDIANILREKYPERKIPKSTLPDFVVKLFSNIDKETKPILNDLNTKRQIDNSKIKTTLHIDFIDLKKSVLDCAESLIIQKVIK